MQEKQSTCYSCALGINHSALQRAGEVGRGCAVVLFELLLGFGSVGTSMLAW
jgi:hypothetical protein